MIKKILLMGLLIPSIANALFVIPDDIIIKKTDKQFYIPDVNRETFYIKKTDLDILNQKKDKMDELEFKNFFNSFKEKQNKTISDFFNIDAPSNYYIMEFSQDKEEQMLFVVIDHHNNSREFEYMIFNKSYIYSHYYPTKKENDYLLKDIVDNDLGIHGFQSYGVYSTMLAFTEHEYKSYYNTPFDLEYAAYLAILKNYKKIQW